VKTRPWTRTRRAVLLGALSPLLFACTTAPAENDGGGGGAGSDRGEAVDTATQAAPAAKGTAVCGRTKPGPKTAPDGAVTVDPGVERDLITKTDENGPGTTFWLAPGTHRFGDGEYEQVTPKEGNVYLGAPGAVLDGRGMNKYGFSGQVTNVTIRHLTVQGFVPPHNEGVVNHDSGNEWVIEYNTIQRNDGAGMMSGAGQQVRENCLKDNGQYGINAYQGDNAITDIVIEGNEIVGNNTDDWEAQIEGCGCTGGVKFWAVDRADIRDNWVHDNRGTGLWADTNNNDFLVENNVIEDNDGPAIFYEVSYNAVIRNNTIRRNNLVEGKKFADRDDSFPQATIYLSEVGGEPRIKARTDKIDVYGNTLVDNWSGITLWENADRFCNSPAHTSSDCTTLVKDKAKCTQPTIKDKPFYDDCRWRTQNVDIHDNSFTVDPRRLGDCAPMCTRMAILSNYGTFPDWSPYMGDVVREAITFDQNNSWHDNTYVGPWTFMAHDVDTIVEFGQWQSTPYGQDGDSTLDRSGG
jgi:Right handed beta helix region